MRSLRVATLFSGIGAPEVALKELGVPHRVVLACDCDAAARKTYCSNLGCDSFYDDVRQVPTILPNLDLLVFGFPCQPFSAAGRRLGLKDPRGKLIQEATRILVGSKPRYFVAENVGNLVRHDGGRTLAKVLRWLRSAEYRVTHTVLNSLDFGVPQSRERVWFVGIRSDLPYHWSAPTGVGTHPPLRDILDQKVESRYFATASFLRKPKVVHSLCSYRKDYLPCLTHTIARNGSSREYISYVAAVNTAVGQLRKPTPQECLRAHGFPEWFRFPRGVSVTACYNQLGNTMSVPVVSAVLQKLVKR